MKVIVLPLLLAKSYGRPRKRKYCWKGRRVTDEAKQLGHTKLVGTGRAKHETQRTILLTTMRYQVSLPTDRGTSFCTLVHNSLIEEAFVAIGFD
jgi:hypothetical protein